MKQMKRLGLLCLLLSLSLLLCACDGKKDDKGDTKDTTTESIDQSSTPDGTSTPAGTSSPEDTGTSDGTGTPDSPEASDDGSASDETPTPDENALVFILNDDGQSYSVKKPHPMLDEVVIPETYEGLPVTEIADRGFKESTLTSITLPASITRIGAHAFESCTALTEVIIHDGVREIGEGAFQFCASLTSLTIPDSVERIERYTFNGCTGILEVDDCVSYVGNWAFKVDQSHEAYNGNVVLREGTVGIADEAFQYHFSLESVLLPETVKYIGNCSFLACEMMNAIYYQGSAAAWTSIQIGEKAFAGAAAYTVYFYSETAPTDTGYFWHYNDSGMPTPWHQ
ncbi:MAG: leucine-rich repeat protein [Clostridia bacterium]|nr:leucine-rich repeat protein [Clostridia bacterium]